MMHVCRINRILESPRGNALLIGVGGSGKQSLSRLAASISSLEVFQITLRKGYSIADLKLDISQLYIKAGLKNMGMVFLMTDAQVADEKFLVLINDLLASGEIPDLFPDDEMENIIGGVRNEVKGLGMEDSRENCWRFFIDKVRRTLKVCTITSLFRQLKQTLMPGSVVVVLLWRFHHIFYYRWCSASLLLDPPSELGAESSLPSQTAPASTGSTNGLRMLWYLYPVVSWRKLSSCL